MCRSNINDTSQEALITNAYKSSENIYDAVLTPNNLLAKLYINLFWGVNDFKIAEKVLNAIPSNFNGALLDIPVGTGVFTCRKYSELTNAKIICVDYSDEMLNQAREKFENIPSHHIQCMKGDVRNLSFENESFDVVLSMNGFHAFPEKQKAFSETERVLKKGGLFIGCFYIKNEKRLTDFVVNNFLVRKGWFTPPFLTKAELEGILNLKYSEVNLFNDKAMAWFCCIK